MIVSPVMVRKSKGDLLIPSRVLDGDFAGWLRDAMASRRMSSRMLGVRAGVDHTTIYRLAAGDRQPSLATAVALLRVLAPEPGRFQPDSTARAGVAEGGLRIEVRQRGTTERAAELPGGRR